MRDPADSWLLLLRDFAEYEERYGEGLAGLRGLARRLAASALGDWVFPCVAGGSLLLSRFEPYADMLEGPHVVVSLREGGEAFFVEYFLNPTMLRGVEIVQGIEALDLERLGRWLDQPLLDGINA